MNTSWHSLDDDPDFTVRIVFTPEARAGIGIAAPSGPATEGLLREPMHWRHVQPGNFVRLEGFAHLWVVLHRTWELMADQTVLTIALDGPLQPDD